MQINKSNNTIYRSVYTACVLYKDSGYYLVNYFLTGKFALLTEKQKEIFEHPTDYLSEIIIPTLLEYGFIQMKMNILYL